MKIFSLAGGIGVLALLLPLAAAGHGSTTPPLPQPSAVGADTVPAPDPVARLLERIESGETTLAHDSVHGYLPALLFALRVPVSSQSLVFSRTSLQTDRIAPWSPRAIYFNDDVYIGYVQGGPFLEIASVDPEEGAAFYTVSQEPSEGPVFQRETTACLMCHSSRAVTDGVPGFIVLSTLADRNGYRIGSVHEGTTTDRTPHGERWGGWYVTGTHGDMRHSGNSLSPLPHHEVPDVARYRREFDMSDGGNLVDLEARFHTGAYLSGHSDIVALMVLAHQTKVHNLITAAHEQAREALRYEPALRSAGASPRGGVRSRGEVRTAGAAERLASALLFAGEAPLQGPVRGTSGFTEEFAALGPHDAKGRSLRDLDLERRLFRYPLSFLIYSDSFEALPEMVKRMVYNRLWLVLSGEDASEEFGHLDAADRRAILEILEETKPEFRELREG